MQDRAKDINTLTAAWKLLEAERMANESLHKQLAVSQAREQQLREALPYLDNLLKTYARKWIEHRNGVCGYVCGDVNTNDLGHVLNILTEVLALPTDTSELEVMITKAGEVMRKRMANEYPKRKMEEYL